MTASERHRVTVVVPVRDEQGCIAGLLEALCAQSRQPDAVVVCDGGSTDGTAAIVERYAARCPAIRLVEAGPALPGRARNVGIAAARSDLVALTDAGTLPGSTWLEALVAPFESDDPPDVVYGRYEPRVSSTLQRCIATAFVAPRDQSAGVRGPSVASMAMRRSVWVRAGGFREDLRSAEDLLFIRRIAALGCAVRYAPDAVVLWTPPPTLRSVLRRFSVYSHANIRAGLAREWQYPLLRTYGMTAALMLAVHRTGLGWLVPVAVLGARAARRVARESGAASLANPPLVIGVMAALLAIDIATCEGFRRWLVSDGWTRLRRRRSRRSAAWPGAG